MRLSAVLDEVLPRMLANPQELCVTNDHGEVVGVVDRERVAALLGEGVRSIVDRRSDGGDPQ